MPLHFKMEMTDDLTEGLKDILRDTPQEVKRSLAHALLAFAHDIVAVPPKPQILTGYTRRSVAIYLDGKLKNPKTVNAAAAMAGGIAPSSSMALGPYEGMCAVTSPYAARLHELRPDQLGPRSKADPGTGPKFVEAKLSRGQLYLNEIARRLLAEWGYKPPDMDNPTPGDILQGPT